MLLRPLLISFLPLVFSYNVLVINPRIGYSHSNYMGSVTDILVDAGHNVTSLISIINENIEDGTKKSTKIHVHVPEEIRKKTAELFGPSFSKFEEKIINIPRQLMVGKLFGGLFASACKETLEQPRLLEKLRSSNFDVVLTENFDVCGLGIAHVIKPKSYITVTTSILYGELLDEAGIPFLPSFNPSKYTSHLDVHSIISRAWNLVGEFTTRLAFDGVRAHTHAVFEEKYGRDFPSWVEISSYAAYMFSNAEPLIDFAHPTTHRVIDLPGLGARDPKPLEKSWLDILSLRERTVLISFGSLSQSSHMSDRFKKGFLEMISFFPDITFLWKYENEDDFAMNDASKVKNLVLTKWMPQNDLLNDKRLVAFISHGGMGSTQETARRGVPTLCIPIGADQPRNSAMMEHNGLGKVYDKFDIPDSAKFTAAMREILEDKRYAKNTAQMAKMLAKKPFTSKEMLIKHVEFAAEFGPSAALRPQSFEMNLIEYHNLDIIAIALITSALVVVFFALAIRKCISRVLRTKTKND